jgi:glycosyltransferase involved in cell wall biosynthesis
MQTTNTRQLSVVLPAYNAAEFLRPAIESILAQTFDDFELIVIDDGSTDNTAEILASFDDSRIRLEPNHRNIGLIATLNKGLRLATAPLVARQDADDISAPNRFALQVEHLQANTNTVAVGAAMNLVDAEDQFIKQWVYPTSPLLCRWQALFDSPMGHSVSMFRRDAVLSAGGYSPDHKYAEDYDLWTRLQESGAIENLEMPLVEYRVHEDSVSQANEDGQITARGVISARGLSRYVGSADCDTILDICSTNTPSLKTVLLSIDAYARLHEHYTQQHDASPVHEIRRLVSSRIMDHATGLSFGQRARVYRRLCQTIVKSRGDRMHAGKMLVPTGVKNLIKRLMNPSHQPRLN